MNDPVLDTLLLPIEDGSVSLPGDGPALFLRARFGDALSRQSRDHFVCEQGFKPAQDTLVRAGFRTRDAADETKYALSLVLPQRQRDENRALLARAVQATRDGGIVMAAASNIEGAKTFEGDLKLLLGRVDSLSKNKCRVFWGRVDPDQVDQAKLAEWIAADAPRDIGGYMSRPGLFAWDRIDAGSKMLVDHLPPNLAGRAADLGVGFGYLSREIQARYPGLTHIDLYEAESRALEMAQLNLSGNVSFIWGDVAKGLDADYDVIVSNPPFHTDHADRHELGQAFIRTAAKSLKTGGVFLMVANRHLPYEETLRSAFKAVTVLSETGAYKVFRAAGPQTAKKLSKA